MLADRHSHDNAFYQRVRFHLDRICTRSLKYGSSLEDSSEVLDLKSVASYRITSITMWGDHPDTGELYFIVVFKRRSTAMQLLQIDDKEWLLRDTPFDDIAECGPDSARDDGTLVFECQRPDLYFSYKRVWVLEE